MNTAHICIVQERGFARVLFALAVAHNLHPSPFRSFYAVHRFIVPEPIFQNQLGIRSLLWHLPHLPLVSRQLHSR